MTTGQEHELHSFLRSAQEKMRSDYERIVKRSKEDPNTAGSAGEKCWQEFLTNWLPPTFKVVTGRRLLRHDGKASRQVDVAVLRPEYPTQLESESYLMSAGVLAAFECKVTLRTTHVKQFLQRSVSVKESTPARYGTPYDELHRPILYGLLCQSHSWHRDETAKARIDASLINYDRSVIEHPSMMPDLVCVADLATWSSSTFLLPPRHPMAHPVSEVPAIITQYAMHKQAIRTVHPLGALVGVLWKKLAKEYRALGAMAEYLHNTDISGIANGCSRSWPPDVLSDEVLNDIKRGRLNTLLGDKWCMTHL